MIMATRQESSEKDMWWVNELEFRGVTVETLNELNNVRKHAVLLKRLQTFYDIYKSIHTPITI